MLLRRISKHVKDQNWFAVALDFVIVVAGILIAFQVTNWNETRQENAALDSYLTSISKNVEFDLDKLDTLQVKRVGAMNLVEAMNWDGRVWSSADIKMPLVRLASELFRSLSEYEYFYADQSGFETFKSSGLLRNIQGYDVESLIFRYYNLANEISVNEADYNQFLKSSFSDFSKEQFEGMVYIKYPDFVGDDAQLVQLQPQLEEILRHPTAVSIYMHAFEKTPELIIKYENLAVLGREIIAVINSKDGPLSSSSSDRLEAFFNIDGNKAYSKILFEGAINSRFFELGVASSSSDPIILSSALNQINAIMPTADWAVFYFRNRANPFSEKPTKDFSDYRAVKLNLKGAVGGEEVWISLKDSTDPDDGSETRVALTLNAEWTIYEIPLSAFETADLTDVFAPMQFISEGDSITFSVREMEFLR